MTIKKKHENNLKIKNELNYNQFEWEHSADMFTFRRFNIKQKKNETDSTHRKRIRKMLYKAAVTLVP